MWTNPGCCSTRTCGTRTSRTPGLSSRCPRAARRHFGPPCPRQHTFERFDCRLLADISAPSQRESCRCSIMAMNHISVLLSGFGCFQSRPYNVSGDFGVVRDLSRRFRVGG